MGSLASKLAIWLLGRSALTAKSRTLLTGAVLGALGAIPLSAIIAENEAGELIVSGETLEYARAGQLHAHARSALENKAVDIIREQVKYEALIGAATKTATPEDMTFYRAALWWGQREEYFLKLLAGREQPEL